MLDHDPQDILSDLGAMRRYARSLTRDDQAADDVVQDALLRAMEKRASFRPDGSRRGWLLAIVHNIFVSSKRREAAEARRNERFAQMLVTELGPEQEQVAQLNEVARAFAALPTQQREVLHLVAVESVSYQDAAHILGVPIGTVMSRLSRARAALRAFREEGDAKMKGLRVVGGRDDD
jgi:RNA polymerase sigma factor (sigma-70 family)